MEITKLNVNEYTSRGSQGFGSVDLSRLDYSKDYERIFIEVLRRGWACYRKKWLDFGDDGDMRLKKLTPLKIVSQWEEITLLRHDSLALCSMHEVNVNSSVWTCRLRCSAIISGWRSSTVM